ncbi:DUF4129 domain-containing protein [Pseudoflavitalea sp. G-6-1-2]|uniref:DUF4129 domain-containing protein n=1 Tax=Pseudoflavitalea sp. G-6-1-2 TaxID=2728841 RepID=UPI00146E8791|nr:DUF4129 domain-containing protein [Pseudoflavitalea sp. G-6-1-2]NML22521.1 DUF4129 domain-containing protein [Pseudoflavitalea sp. G-6-1-2]
MFRCLLVAVLLMAVPVVHAQENTDTTVLAPEVDLAPVTDEEVTEAQEEEEKEVEAWPPTFRQVPDSTAKRIRSQKDFEYANDPAYWTQKKRKDRTLKEPTFRKSPEPFLNFSGMSGLVRILIIAGFFILLAFLVYKLLGNRWPWQLKEAELKEEEEAAADEMLDPNSLEAKIKQAAAAKKFRHAIRYTYLLTLRNLDAKGWIQYQAKSTNSSYVNQVRQFDPKGVFAYLTNVYDYVWYGEFELNEEQFSKVYKDFQSFTNIPNH